MRLKTIILLAGVLAPAFSVGAFMNLFSGFTVEREVIVGPEKFSEPGNLVKASDGGYFVIGRETGIAWATKTDADGKVLWTVEEPAPAGTAAHFLTAAASSDGGVLLCGRRDSLGERGIGRAALLLRLDKDGHEVRRIDPYLNDPSQVDQILDVTACIPWDDGFAVTGAARISEQRADGVVAKHETAILMRLKSDGSIIWRHNVQNNFDTFQAISDGTLVLQGYGGNRDGIDFLKIIRVDGNGRLLAENELDHECELLHEANSSDRLIFICNLNAPLKPIKSIELTLNLKEMNVVGYPDVKNIAISKGYYLRNDALLLIGTRLGTVQRFVPTVAEVGINKKENATHEFIGQSELGLVGGMPTDRDGEYVVLRIVQGGNRRSVMTFLRHN